MHPERLVTAALGLFCLFCLLALNGCWVFQEEETAECPVAGRDSDARRMPPYVPATPGDDFGDSTADGEALITLRAPRGHYSLSVHHGFEVVDRICASDSGAECPTRLTKLDFDVAQGLAHGADAGELGDFEARCEAQGDACNYIALDCELDLCDATLTVPLHLEVRGPLGEPLAVTVQASMTGDVCDERLPVATVQLTGWEEPPVRVPAD